MQIFKKPEKIEWLFMSIIESCKNCILRINQENIFLVRFSSLCLRHKIIIKMILSNVIRCALMTIKINHEKNLCQASPIILSSFSFTSDLTFYLKRKWLLFGFYIYNFWTRWMSHTPNNLLPSFSTFVQLKKFLNFLSC